jgi:hypothetical protein
MAVVVQAVGSVGNWVLFQLSISPQAVGRAETDRILPRGTEAHSYA